MWERDLKKVAQESDCISARFAHIPASEHRQLSNERIPETPRVRQLLKS